MTEWFYVGKIVNTHGIKGEVRVISDTDFTEDRYASGEKLYLSRLKGSRYEPLIVESYRRHKQFDLLKFEGLNNINDVEAFKGSFLFIPKEQLSPLEDNAFYYHEIIGCEVVTEDGNSLGKIKEILSPGANDVWVVKTKGKDILLPYIEDVVKHVDIADKKVTVHLMAGLVDDEN
ncbi:ribosome maturation factor RimM [Scopulibacillus darangshiensis]|nr:ribosome maturation factor RimM [Scopulibacillus darangshiensis]